MRLLLVLLGVGFFLAPVVAGAEADVFGLGNGQHGVLRVREADTVLNVATPLEAPARAGETALRVADAQGFAAGELVLVLQVGSEGPLATGPGPMELRETGVGRWELARLAEVAPGLLRLTAPLVGRYGGVSQVVRVPEHTEVAVGNAASLRAPRWDGRSGGVLALLATGTVFNQGAMQADGAGLRGGEAESLATPPYDCRAEDGPVSSGGGSRKGEGLASALVEGATHGYGRLASGGGGGNCHDAGGGGGGHAGRGGQGGHTSPGDGARDVGGRGGAGLHYEPMDRLLLGGGGGAGTGNVGGGAGGGILFLRARQVQGPRPRGIFSANGQPGASALIRGGGGGGAGGTVHLRVAESLGCTVLEAVGGAGGHGVSAPGGGGGGGQLLLQARGGPSTDCALSVRAGLAGLTAEGPRGAEPTEASAPDFAGRVLLLDSAFTPPRPGEEPGSAEPRALAVGFGCGATSGGPGGAGWLLVGLAGWAWRRRGLRAACAPHLRCGTLADSAGNSFRHAGTSSSVSG